MASASTTSLPTLLKSLNIGVPPPTANGQHDEASSSSNIHAAPKLALSDQLHLLSAHIDTLEKSIQARVTSQDGRDTIKRQGQRSIEIQRRVLEVQRRVQLLEEHDESRDVGGNAVLECLAQYINAKKKVQKERRLHHVTALVRDAVLAIERLEERLQNGRLDADGLTQVISEANHQTSLLGIRGAESTGKSNADGDDYSWIGKASTTPPLAMQELGSRLERAKQGVHQLLADSWNECVIIRADSTSFGLGIKLKATAFNIELPQLMATLQSRSELKPLLEKLARDIIEQVLSPMLSSRKSWKYDGQSAEEWRVNRDETGNIPSDTATALARLLGMLQERLCALAPIPAQASFTVSKNLVPAFLPTLLKYFKSSLPSQLEKPIASTTLPRLGNISKAAKEVHDALAGNNFLQRDLRDEADELLDWSKNAPKHYMKGLGTQLRTKARDLLLREAGGGWQAVTVDFEAEEEMPIAVQESKVPVAAASTQFEPEADEKAEEAWSHWDTESTQPIHVQEPARSSSLSRQTRQKKSALGGRRVVKPADELGSGPLPENADEVSWGFDDETALDELNVASSSTVEAPKKTTYDALMEALDQDEDVDEDAWGLTEEEKVEIAAKRASMRGGDMAAAFQAYQASQEKEKEKSSILQQIPVTEEIEDDEDDAWGLSAQEAAHEVEAGKSSGSGEKLSDTTTDPWEEVSASRSNAAASVTSFVEVGAGSEAHNKAADSMPASSTIKETLYKAAPSTAADAATADRDTSRTPLRSGQSPSSQDSALPVHHSKSLQPASLSNPVSSPEVAAPPPLTFTRPKEKCVISKRSVSLIDLIHSVLDDLGTILEENMGEVLKTSYLVSALNDILDMHRGLLPAGHSHTLASVPSLAMQFANDCLYIGKELKEMRKRWDAIQSRLPEGEKLDLNTQAELTISLGKRAFDGQLLLQHKTLLDCLQDADGFTRTYEESRFSASQRSIKQVELILKQLQAAWKPVLTRSSYLVAMGRLVEGLLKKLLLDIESIEDISEVESEKLASLIKTVGELEYLFREEGQPAEESVVALYVPSWFKASYLSEILTGSLVDIEFLYFEAGALVDYSKAEVVSLIRSLFADTPKRARVIDRIQSS